MKHTKFLSRLTVRLITFSAFLFFDVLSLQAQVFTRLLQPGEKMEDYILWYSLQKPAPLTAPAVDVAAVLLQDSLDANPLYRFGIKTAVNYAKSDGTIYDFGNFDVWKLVVRSNGAKSLNFEFEDMVLPVGSIMYVYSPQRKMLIGPVGSKHITEGKFATDIVYGDEVVIDVFLPAGTREAFNIRVNGVVHGIRETEAQPRAFGDSEDCNVNTVCPISAGWQNEIGAVCLILVNGIGHCTASLINNECGDFTPFLLTANHCVEGNDVTNWVFRFRYESATCPEQVEPVTWFFFTGAQLRANWDGSDFALLELNNSVQGSNVSFAGWNRTEPAPSNNVVAIHHPQGDVKKISFNTDGITTDGNFWNIEQWELGLVEPGSSGSPLFDENRLIIGDLHGGDLNIGCEGDHGLVDNNTYGRFSISWDGGGTDETRLSTWLGGGGNPATLQGAALPTIPGSNVLCTTPQTYTLLNPLLGYTVSWSVVPTNLFGSPTSGTGLNATLWASNNTNSGEATLTYTLNHLTCGERTFSRTIWVGRPAVPVIQGPQCFIPGSNVVLYASAPGAYNYTWAFPPCPYGIPQGDPISGCWFNYSGNGPSSSNILAHVGAQDGSISVFTGNVCGTSSVNLPIIFCGGGEPGGGVIIRSKEEPPAPTLSSSDKISIFPNPSKGTFALDVSALQIPATVAKRMQLLSPTGRTVFEQPFMDAVHTVDATGVPPGIYFVRVEFLGGFATQKVLIH